MLAAAFDGDEVVPPAMVGREIEAFDETEAAAFAAHDEWRDRQEQLVDDVRGDEATQEMRTALGEDDPAPVSVDERRQVWRTDEVARADDLDRDVRREALRS